MRPVWGSTQSALMEVLNSRPADVAQVVGQLSDLQELLENLTPAASNPVADFNRLYRIITATIQDRLEAGAFGDPEFLNLLDVEFAQRYFDALIRWGRRHPETPDAWSELFCRLRDRKVRPIQGAAAGVNAHINYDLPFALITTWEKLGSSPADERQHGDYLLINEVFFERIPELRRSYLTNWQLIIDRLNFDLDDWYQDRLVELCRNLAWQDAERLWRIRADEAALEEARDSLDRHTAFIGAALLSPVCRLIQ